MELTKGYWTRVGIDIQIRSEGRSLFNGRWFSDQQDANVFTGEFGGRDAIFFPPTFPPTGGNGYAPTWGLV